MRVNEGCGFVPGIVDSPANKEFGVLSDPGVIGRDMVRHEIQKELHASLRQLLPRDCKTCRTSKVLINHIASNAVGRSDIVFWLEVRQSSPEIVEEISVLIGNRNARRTSFPNSHEPNTIETELGDSVPLG